MSRDWRQIPLNNILYKHIFIIQELSKNFDFKCSQIALNEPTSIDPSVHHPNIDPKLFGVPVHAINH